MEAAMSFKVQVAFANGPLSNKWLELAKGRMAGPATCCELCQEWMYPDDYLDHLVRNHGMMVHVLGFLGLLGGAGG